MSDVNKPAQAEHRAAESSDATPDMDAVERDSQLETLRRELDQFKAKAEEHWNLYLQARAEIENVRKRGERDLANAHKFALEKFVNELLPVKDSLEMGLAAASESNDLAKLKEGKELTLRMLGSALDKFGVREIDPKGEKFNPELHEAMAMQPATDVEPNTVVQVVQKGYLLNDRLVRPAMVVVARAEARSSSER
jgi:molecular chaperone GrpE